MKVAGEVTGLEIRAFRLSGTTKVNHKTDNPHFSDDCPYGQPLIFNQHSK